jgi:hypothetical protein
MKTYGGVETTGTISQVLGVLKVGRWDTNCLLQNIFIFSLLFPGLQICKHLKTIMSAASLTMEAAHKCLQTPEHGYGNLIITLLNFINQKST